MKELNFFSTHYDAACRILNLVEMLTLSSSLSLGEQYSDTRSADSMMWSHSMLRGALYLLQWDKRTRAKSYGWESMATVPE